VRGGICGTPMFEPLLMAAMVAAGHQRRLPELRAI
jgi:hypothetical protein